MKIYPVLAAFALGALVMHLVETRDAPVPDHPTNPSIGGYILESPDHAKERLEISPTSSDHAVYHWKPPPGAKDIEITIYGAGGSGSVYAEPKGPPK